MGANLLRVKALANTGQSCIATARVAYAESEMGGPLTVSQLHLHCSHCDHSIVINDNHVSQIMYVNCNATGSISHILDNDLYHRSQEICRNWNAPFDSTIHFSETHKMYHVCS